MTVRIASSEAWVLASSRVDAFGWIRIVVILVTAYLLSRFLPRIARRVVRRLLDSQMRRRLVIFGARAPRPLRDSQPVPLERQHQRAEAIGTLVKGLFFAAIWATASVLVLHELHVALATVVTGAGFLGLAVAFGAQDLIRDYLSGLFILLDDRYGVGDRVRAGSLEGAVEEVTLRWTRVRDFEGTEWYVPNSRMAEVGNRSLHEGRAIIDVEIPPSLPLSGALARIDDAIEALHRDEEVGSLVLEEPHVLGVETLGVGTATVRVAVVTPPHRQADVARALRTLIRREFERHDRGPERDPSTGATTQEDPASPQEHGT
jgi:small conductance mechanosensitive channel